METYGTPEEAEEDDVRHDTLYSYFLFELACCISIFIYTISQTTSTSRGHLQFDVG